MLDEFKDNRKSSDHLIKDRNNRFIGIVNINYLYLRDDLPNEERKHFIKRGILWSQGFHGVTYNYKDSYFWYKDEQKEKNLSDLDIEAIRFMYGGKLRPGMDLEDTKMALGLPT